MEDRLAATVTDVDEHAVVLEPGAMRYFRDELEHPLRLFGGELGYVAEGVDVPFGENEQVGLGLGVDVANRDEAVGLGDVVAGVRELAEQAIVRQRGSPPP